MKFDFRSRILYGVRLFLFLTAASAYALDPVTIEGRINRNAFPFATHAKKYAEISKGADTELRARIDQVLTPVRLAPASWMRASFGQIPPSGERRKILESYAETEIWKCRDTECAGCGADSTGCVLSKTVAGGVGVVGVIHPCLIGEGKCPRGASANLGEWIERYVLGVAYFKAGLAKNTSALRKAAKNSSEWIASTSRSVNLLLGACPGPYSADSLKFLFGLEAVTLPNPAILKCGQTYLEELRDLPAKCRALSGTLADAWSEFSKSRLRVSADVLRCDAYCMKMLCRPKTTATVFTAFSGKPALLLGDDACEGESPKLRGQFLREALPRVVRAKLEVTGCLPSIEKSMTGLGDGPGVQLLE